MEMGCIVVCTHGSMVIINGPLVVLGGGGVTYSYSTRMGAMIPCIGGFSLRKYDAMDRYGLWGATYTVREDDD